MPENEYPPEMQAMLNRLEQAGHQDAMLCLRKTYHRYREMLEEVETLVEDDGWDPLSCTTKKDRESMNIPKRAIR